MGNNATFQFFKDAFGFNVKETVALLGAHTLGKAHRNDSGFDGNWVEKGDLTFDNEYYKLMISDEVDWRNEVLFTSLTYAWPISEQPVILEC